MKYFSGFNSYIFSQIIYNCNTQNNIYVAKVFDDIFDDNKTGHQN